MIAHGFALASLIAGGKFDQRSLDALLVQTGVDGPLAALSQDYLRGGLGQGPAIPLIDFVKRVAGLLASAPHLTGGVERLLARRGVRIADVEAFLRKAKATPEGGFATAFQSAKHA